MLTPPPLLLPLFLLAIPWNVGSDPKGPLFRVFFVVSSEIRKIFNHGDDSRIAAKQNREQVQPHGALIGELN